MYQIKGFFSIDTFFNNDHDTVAKFGELSSTSRTYAKDIKEYTSALAPNVNFTLFYSKKDQELRELDITTRDLILSIGEWLYAQGDAITASTSPNGLATSILNQYQHQVMEVKCGSIEYDTIRRLPTYVSFKLRNTSEDTYIKIWLADEALQLEYDEYEIVIIPPFENIDQFFMPANDVRALISKIDSVDTIDRINEAKGAYPYTLLRAENINYVNPSNNLDTINVYWHAIVYGRAGDDSELIRQAIIKYIQDHSRSAESEWKVILPDLFNITAFYILPRWDKYAIPDRRTIPGIYSPIINYKEVKEFALYHLGGMVSNTHVEEYMEVTIHRYRSITLVTVGGEENRRDLFKISDYFPDYIAEETTHEDFNRQKEATKKFTSMMTELLVKAENYESNPLLPSNTRLVSRNNRNFLVRKFDNVEYYVALKSSIVK